MKAIDEINAMVKAAGRYDDPMRVKERLARVQKRVGPARSYFAGLGASDPELRFGQTSKRPSVMSSNTTPRTLQPRSAQASRPHNYDAATGLYNTGNGLVDISQMKSMQMQQKWMNAGSPNSPSGKAYAARTKQQAREYLPNVGGRWGAYAGRGTPAASGNNQMAGGRGAPNRSGGAGSLNEYGGPGNMGVAGTHTCPTCRGSGRTA